MSCRAMLRVGLILCLVPHGLHAAAPALIPMTTAQASGLGITTGPLRTSRGTVLAGLPAVGVVPASQWLVVSAPLAGLVEEAPVAVHESVRKGQTLVRLRSPVLAELRRDAALASSQERLARENAERDRRLFDEGIIAESRYRAARAVQEEARATLAQRRQVISLAGADARGDGTTIVLTAPADGLVLEQSAVTGQRVEASAPLYRIARAGATALDIQVPLDRAAGLGVGAAVSVPGLGLGGKVTSVGRSVAGATQTVTVRAVLDNADGRLRPGEAVEAEITLEASSGRGIEVPSAAVARQGGRTWVFAAATGGFRPVPVQVLHEGIEVSSIRADFTGTDRIAVRGIAALKALMPGVQ